jgi:single-strand DNA-binding protein
VEKYSTEVVLQRFRGEMTLLDSRGGGQGASEGGRDPAGSGSDFGSSGPMERRPASGGGGGSGGGRPTYGDMDDEIPF